MTTIADFCHSCFRVIPPEQAFFCSDDCRDDKIIQHIREGNVYL